jgi:hypothetical protein
MANGIHAWQLLGSALAESWNKVSRWAMIEPKVEIHTSPRRIGAVDL